MPARHVLAMPVTSPDGLKLGGYDFIFSKLAFHHIRDCGQMVRALVPFLADGGRLLIVDLEKRSCICVNLTAPVQWSVASN